MDPRQRALWLSRRRRLLLESSGASAPPGAPLLWYDPSDAANYTLTASEVTGMTDLGSAGLDLTDGGTVDVTLATLSNGLNGLQFTNGADQELQNTTALTDLQDWTVAFVANIAADATTDIWGLLGWSNATRTNGWRVGNTGADLCTWTARQYTSDAVQVAVPSAEGSPAIFTCTWEDSVESRTYKNGTMVAEDTVLAAGSTGTISTEFSLGRFAGATGAMGGILGEVIVYQSLLSAADLASLESYLNTKWAVY